jgi:hypothetical protein
VLMLRGNMLWRELVRNRRCVGHWVRRGECVECTCKREVYVRIAGLLYTQIKSEVTGQKGVLKALWSKEVKVDADGSSLYSFILFLLVVKCLMYLISIIKSR